MTPCMGGWCDRRGACAHYTNPYGEPVERLCPRDVTVYFQPRLIDREQDQKQEQK